MTYRLSLAAAWLVSFGLLHAAPGSGAFHPIARPQANAPRDSNQVLTSDLDRIFDSPVFARALLGVRVESLSNGRLWYARNPDRLVMPASNMKVVTVATAVARFGWDYRYETRLDAVGSVANGTLTGDLIVTGSGDPSIGSPDGGHATLFLEWADALQRAGIRTVDGRLIGNDTAFDNEGLGAGWAWDYLAAGYAAPVGALSYNENSADLRTAPAATPGRPATIVLGPPGHGLDLMSTVTTGTPSSIASIDLRRFPGTPRLIASGSVPAGGAAITRAAAVDNPTRFFVEGLQLALASRGIRVARGAWDIDDLPKPPASTDQRRLIATHESAPMSSLVGYALKVSQNFYVEAFLKTLGRTIDHPGSTDAGRRIVRDTLTSWGVPTDSVVMYDGSGLSRYNYVTASTMVAILRHVWEDQRLRGPFVAALPVGGRDGTLDIRMRNTVLDRNVQAKTGTISNVRALSGFLETASGEKLVFSMIANNFTAPNADVDAVVENALTRLVGP